MTNTALFLFGYHWSSILKPAFMALGTIVLGTGSALAESPCTKEVKSMAHPKRYVRHIFPVLKTLQLDL